LWVEEVAGREQGREERGGRRMFCGFFSINIHKYKQTNEQTRYASKNYDPGL